MKPAVKALALVAASLLCSACFNVGLVVTVRPDGRGTIDETVMMTAQAVQQLAGLAAMAGEGGKTGVSPNEMFKEEEIRKRAEQLGAGVRLESVEPIKNAEGEGYRARYSFDDITKLALAQVPDPPVSGMTAGPKNAGKMKLRLDRGATGSLLTVTMPEPEVGDKPAAGETMMPDDMPPEAMGMMKQMFKGARMSVVLAVDGSITRTNAPPALVNGSRVTIAEIDFEQLFADPAAMEKLRSLKSLDEARKIGASMPGLRMFLEPELVIQFSGR